MQAQQKTILNYAKSGRPYEILAALIAARSLNNTIVETDLQSENGKKRQLKINYYAPVCTDAGTCDDNICNPGVVVEPKQVFFEVGRCTSSAVYQLNKDDIRYVDGAYSFSDHAKAVINSALPTVRRKLALEVAGALYAGKGLMPDGSTSKLLPFVDKSNGTVNPVGLWEVERIYRDAGFGAPFVVGGSDVFYWKKAVEIGGLNSLGQNVAQMGRTNAYYDSLINEVAGDDTHEHLLAFDPQMLKFVTFNRNAGIFATDLQNIEAIDAIYQRGGTDYIEGTLADPLTGLLWDLNVNYDKCNHRWTFQWKLEWDLFFLPPMVCNIPGVNGITEFLSCLPAAVECPTPDPGTPPASDTFDLDLTDFTLPMFVNKLTVAGQTSYPNITVASNAEFVAMLNANVNGYNFTLSTTNARYTGYTAIGGEINDTTALAWVATP